MLELVLVEKLCMQERILLSVDGCLLFQHNRYWGELLKTLILNGSPRISGDRRNRFGQKEWWLVVKAIIKYRLPIYSQTLENDPVFENKGLDVYMELLGRDDDERLRKIILRFESVLCSKHTSSSFTSGLYDSYDKVVELVDSKWLEALKKANEESFNYWDLKHYLLYLDERGLFEFIAHDFEVEEFD